MKRILILTGDAGEAQEIYYAKFRLEEEGHTVHIATTTKRVFHSVVHDFDPGYDTYTETPGYRVEADLGLDEVSPGSYDGLVLPGGRAPEFLRNRPKALEIVRHFIAENKPIAANCHGPLLLFAAGWGKGKRTTCYPELECDAKVAGATYQNAPVVVDGNVVSVRGWPDNGPWMREFIRILSDQSSA
jgi:deglycase